MLLSSVMGSLVLRSAPWLLAAFAACADASNASSSSGADGSTSTDSSTSAADAVGETTSAESDTTTPHAADTTTDSGSDDASSSTTGDIAPPGPCDPLPSVEPWTGPWQPPHALHLGVCSAREAAAIASCFVDAQNCDVPVSAACHGCAVSGAESAEAGPLRSELQGQPGGLNVPGCVAQLDGDPSADGCGPKLQAYLVCVDEACAACMDPDLLSGCEREADASTCSAAADAAACARPYLAQCEVGATDLEVAFELIAIFCGP
jgi:hypothetical protein